MDVSQEATVLEGELSVEWLDEQRTQCLHVPASWLAPFQEAIAVAILSQTVYWVGCPAVKWPAVATFQDDAGLQRLLRAIATDQTVSRSLADRVADEAPPEWQDSVHPSPPPDAPLTDPVRHREGIKE